MGRLPSSAILSERRCHHGTQPGIAEAQLLGQVCPTPGDGACFWHAAARDWSSQHAKALKQRVFSLLGTQPETVAAWLGANPQEATAIAHDWASWDSWADARALTIVSLLCDVSILVVNCKDNLTELYTPAANVSGIGETWVLNFNQDHFSNVLVEDIPRLHAILESFALTPVHQRDAPSQHLKGGAISASQPPEMKVPYHDMYPQHESSLSESCACAAIRCQTLNVGGMRAHLHDIVEQCHQPLSLLALQETNVTDRFNVALIALSALTGLRSFGVVLLLMFRPPRAPGELIEKSQGLLLFTLTLCLSFLWLSEPNRLQLGKIRDGCLWLPSPLLWTMFDIS